MSTQQVNPFSSFKTNLNSVNTTSANTAATNPQKAENTAQQDSKNNKKAAIVGTLAALAFAGTVAAVAIKRHKVPDEVQSALNNFKTTNEAVNTLAEDVQKQVDETIECAQKLFDEVTRLFKKGDEIAADGTVLRKITGDDTVKIMEEFSQDGVLTRSSYFVNGVPRSITEGIEEFADGSQKIAREVDFYENGKLAWYREGYEFHSDGLWKFAKEIDFYKNGKPGWYREGHEFHSDGLWKCAKEIIFEDGKPSWYYEGSERLADGLKTIAKKIDFKDGKPFCYHDYHEGVEVLADRSEKIAKHYELTDKGWQEILQ